MRNCFILFGIVFMFSGLSAQTMLQSQSILIEVLNEEPALQEKAVQKAGDVMVHRVPQPEETIEGILYSIEFYCNLDGEVLQGNFLYSPGVILEKARFEWINETMISVQLIDIYGEESEAIRAFRDKNGTSLMIMDDED